MAIFTVPFLSLQLVEHSAGGVILRNSLGYIAGTHIDASVVAAFSTASSVLTSLGSGVVGVATSPVVLGTAAVLTVAAGTYVYFYGLPAPITASLSKAGLGASAKKGFVVTAPKLAVALVLLGAAGYASYHVFSNFSDLRKARAAEALSGDTIDRASPRPFGEHVWRDLGAAMWSTAQSARDNAVRLAYEAVALSRESVAGAHQSAAEVAGSVARASDSQLRSWWALLRKLLGVRPSST